MEKSSCYIFAFATFGHPNDFRQTPFKYNNPDIANRIKIFDLTNAIKVFPNSTIYSIRKEEIGGSKLISYAIYTYAQEQASKREGTFIGSSIILENKLSEEKYIISCLNEFHSKLIENNLNNDVLKVNHSKDFKIIDQLSDFDKIKTPQIDISDLDFNFKNKNLVVFCDTSANQLSSYLKSSLVLLNLYDSIFFTNNEEVVKFVHQKGIFKLIQNVGDKKEFEIEINNLIEVRKRKKEQSISEFKSEVDRINADKDRTIQEFKSKIEQYEKEHLENDKRLKEFKSQVAKIGQFYSDFLQKTQGLMSRLNHNNDQLEYVKQTHNRNKILFNENIGELKNIKYLTKIEKVKPKSNLNIEYLNQNLGNRSSLPDRVNEEIEKRGFKIEIYKITTVILAVLLLVTWAFIIFYKGRRAIKHIQKQQNVRTEIIHQEQTPNQITTTNSVVLIPIPNSELNQNDYRRVAKSIVYQSKVEDVVKIIFDKNPTEIKSHYLGQEKIYSKYLLENNKDCFKEKDGVYYFSKDTIKHIPSFKKR